MAGAPQSPGAPVPPVLGAGAGPGEEGPQPDRGDPSGPGVTPVIQGQVERSETAPPVLGSTGISSNAGPPPWAPSPNGRVPEPPIQQNGSAPAHAVPSLPALAEGPTPPDGFQAPPPPPPGPPAAALMPAPGQSARQVEQRSLFTPTPPPSGPIIGPGRPSGSAAPPPDSLEADGGRRPLLLAIGAVGLLVVVGVVGFVVWRAMTGGPSTATPTAATSAPVAEPSASAEPPEAAGNSVLNAEATDPQKLGLAEAFPDKKVEFKGVTYTRVKTEMTGSCDKAGIGKFADALTQNKCARVLRATYVDGKKRHAITTGIAVFPTREDSVAADKAKNLGTNVWFRGLPGAKGSGAERVHIAGGYASGVVWGRYIVFSYATNADGRTPTDKDKALGEVSGAFRDNTSMVLERRITG
ncbi:hypothetical protein [Spongiactinospora sp. TRM90649]|uniref:hypothetical protein n=1 Tax=Spongiactinospora sp. TRM90649 TaxID=3031114 RepID=UPI0023F974AA|nr:hypothetical protein [Spongiactinospora sp. TRM90649]MDF5751499.1 hypothetical protein [Spongiactinospora sp. TRM90649]